MLKMWTVTLEVEPTDKVDHEELAEEAEFWEYRIGEYIGRVYEELLDAKLNTADKLEWRPVDFCHIEFGEHDE